MSIRRRVKSLESKSVIADDPEGIRALTHRAFRGDEMAFGKLTRVNLDLSAKLGQLAAHPLCQRAVAEMPAEVLVAHAVRHGLEAALPPGLQYLVPAARAATMRSTSGLSRPAPAWLTPEFLAAEAVRLKATHLLGPSTRQLVPGADPDRSLTDGETETDRG